MPYVEQTARNHLDRGIEPLSAGELNYLITKLVIDYLDSKEVVGYAELNEVVGVLECAKEEFIRRILTPYERSKQLINGDVGYTDLWQRMIMENNYESSEVEA